MRIEWFDDAPACADELDALLYSVLYRDFGVARDAAWHAEEPGSAVAVALAPDGEILGTVRLLAVDDEASCQARQLAVAPHAHRGGFGRALMEAAEARAREFGANELWLHARHTAFPFYERLGYEYVSEEFVSALTGIPHRTMRKYW